MIDPVNWDDTDLNPYQRMKLIEIKAKLLWCLDTIDKLEEKK